MNRNCLPGPDQSFDHLHDVWKVDIVIARAVEQKQPAVKLVGDFGQSIIHVAGRVFVSGQAIVRSVQKES